MAAAQLLQSEGGAVALGRELGRGGEGSVFEIAGNPDLVAKIYHSPPTAEKSAKLLAMLQLATPQVHALTAWPRDVLRARDGRIQGLLMSNVAGYKDIHSLYGPKSRRADFPDADWRHLIRAAAMTVRLIDCDSFQVHDNSGRTFFCEVGVENFTPPELQGRPLRGLMRTANHDNFGLAVLVFYLLMVGRHPFAGRFLGKGEMPIEKAIAEHRYAYGHQAKARLMEAPPFTPCALSASEDVANLWERAFAPEAASSLVRPSAREWITTLAALEHNVSRCSQHAGHYFHNSVRACPWCPIESTSGALLFFIPLAAIPASGLFTLAVVWSRIEQVGRPGPVPEISVPVTTASPEAARAGRVRVARKLIGRISVLAALVIALTVNPSLMAVWWLVGVGIWVAVGRWAESGGLLATVRQTRQEAANQLKRLGELLRTETDPQSFDQQRKILDGKRTELQSLPAVRAQRMKVLIANRERNARQRFLERHRIETGKIPGVGPSKRAMLQSYRIETAADIEYTAVLGVPGFGPALASRLEEWRRDVENSFLFNPNSEVDPRDVNDLDRKIAVERSTLEQALLQGANQLSQIRQQILVRREALLAQAHPFAMNFAQADADCKALTGQS